MTDLPPPAAEGVSPSAAERLAALRTPSKQPGRPALAAKILAAGLSTTAMLGLVTAMGLPADPGGGQAAAPPTSTGAPITNAPATTITPLAPATTLPGAQPTTVPPVTVPAAIPVDQVPVQVVAGRTTSNITTKTSG